MIRFRSRRKHAAAEGERIWPDYERCVAGAPPSKEGSGRDRSTADFFWCMRAAQNGWSIEETANKLMGVSAKAQEPREILSRVLCVGQDRFVPAPSFFV